MEYVAKERESRVSETVISSREFLSTMEHEGSVGIWANHGPRLNT